jgi:hypothetical protein
MVRRAQIKRSASAPTYLVVFTFPFRHAHVLLAACQLSILLRRTRNLETDFGTLVMMQGLWVFRQVSS